MGDKFRGLVASRPGEAATLQDVSFEDLPAGDVLVKVSYSSLNYKDGLAVLGRPGVVKTFPMIPGLDLAGEVVSSDSSQFKKGDCVFLTGWGVGESHWGGYAEYARVKSEWLLPCPAGMNQEQAMTFGTAGLTAMLSVLALERHGLKHGDKVLVTGAGGGVGGLSTLILAQRGYLPSVVTGRPELRDYLEHLGAKEVLSRDDVLQGAKALGKERWAGAIDSVGGQMLSAILSQTAYHGCVAACGLAGGAEFVSSVFPFILRGITLTGIESVRCPADLRTQAWNQLAELSAKTGAIAEVHSLKEVPRLSREILEGQTRGRVVIKISD